MYNKTLQVRNLRENDKFHSKLVYFGLDKHTSLDKQKTLTYQEICKLQMFIVQALGLFIPVNVTAILESLHQCI